MKGEEVQRALRAPRGAVLEPVSSATPQIKKMCPAMFGPGRVAHALAQVPQAHTWMRGCDAVMVQKPEPGIAGGLCI